MSLCWYLQVTIKIIKRNKWSRYSWLRIVIEGKCNIPTKIGIRFVSRFINIQRFSSKARFKSMLQRTRKENNNTQQQFQLLKVSSYFISSMTSSNTKPIIFLYQYSKSLSMNIKVSIMNNIWLSILLPWQFYLNIKTKFKSFV